MPGLKEGPFGRPPPRAIEDSGKGAVFPSAPPDFSALARLPDNPHSHVTGEQLEDILGRLLGVMQRHPEPRYKHRTLEVFTPSGLAAGASLLSSDGLNPAVAELPFDCKSIVVDNPTGYRLRVNGLERFIPAGVFGFTLRCDPTLSRISVLVKDGTQAAADYILLKATEEPLQESGGVGTGGAGGATANVTITNVPGSQGIDGSTTIAAGGTAQNLFGGVTPTNGFEICNPDPGEDLWVSDSTTAANNGTGSYRVGPNGNTYTTPTGYRPIGPVSIIGATTGHHITARRW